MDFHLRPHHRSGRPALFSERAFDQGADAIYKHINEGKLETYKAQV
ncbi:Cytochrome b-c1 complex subunit 9 [Apodemus speciosus]|uniref:Cytochrome b-c1 complex subunit 9 n=1 Tax=Apodemus speciosus TaxID=105296 RepID=A0ABQ0EIV5_APOSI